MTTRITITSTDRLTITRNSVRYDNPGTGQKWTVTSSAPSFERMFLNLCTEVEHLIPLAGQQNGGETTVFTIKEDDGSEDSYVLSQPEEEYAVCFTIIDQMVRQATQKGHDQ